MEIQKIASDVNGNPRYVVHFLALLNDEEKYGEDNGIHHITNLYDLAAKKAKKIGGKKYRGKDFGGGIVFQSFNLNDLEKEINEVRNNKR